MTAKSRPTTWQKNDLSHLTICLHNFPRLCLWVWLVSCKKKKFLLTDWQRGKYYDCSKKKVILMFFRIYVYLGESANKRHIFLCLFVLFAHYYTVCGGSRMCKRRGHSHKLVSHILAEKGFVSFTLLKKMQENAIFSPIRRRGVRRVRPMMDPPLLLLLLPDYWEKWRLMPLL